MYNFFKWNPIFACVHSWTNVVTIFKRREELYQADPIWSQIEVTRITACAFCVVSILCYGQTVLIRRYEVLPDQIKVPYI